MKYILLIPDGMADWEIKGKTPLEMADTPNMDYLANKGSCGIAKTVPDGFEPGSDVANLTILGVDVRKYYTGRGPIEALAMGVNGKIIFRCNLVYVKDGILVDYSGNRISDEEARKVINALNKEIKINFIKFYPGRSYRNLLVINADFDTKIKTTPPHDIQGEKIESYLPKNGELAELLLSLMEKSKKVVEGVTDKANMIWLWGGGKLVKFPNFRDKWGVNGFMISEVDLLEGIGKGLGFEIGKVDGLTGYIDTNYRGLAKAVLKGLKTHDFVVLHTEGIDEVSHEGDLDKKIEGISIYDEKIVGYLLDRIDVEETKIMLLPDHPTPVKVRTHVAEPVPFLLRGGSVKKDDVKIYSEKSCRRGRFGVVDGLKLMDFMFRL
ncbi:cofactor-independent phosphoglycerate mutase [Archaeoglobales archaeon]|nr:MAG: cofactor-independent phosphoglycerate mutase [Archaeoglobales archaeon]